MRGTGMLAILSGALLWGCTVPGPPERSPEPPAPPAPARAVAVDRAGTAGANARACAAARYRALVGRPIAGIDTAALPRPLRVVRAGHRITMDHRPERMKRRRRSERARGGGPVRIGSRPAAPPSGYLAPLAATMLVQAMTAMAVVTVPVLAPEIAAAIAIDTAAVGLHQSIAYVGAAALTLVSGSLVLRHGGIRINQASALLSATGVGLVLAGAAPAIALGAILAGMGYGLATPGASHVLARVTPAARRGLVFSIKQSAVPLGGLVAGVLFPPIAERFGWPCAVSLSCAMAASAAFVIQRLRVPLDADRNRAHRVRLGAPGDSIRLVLATPALRPIALVAFSYGAVQLSLFAFLVTYLVERAALDLVTAGLLFAVMQGAGVVARVGWGWMNDRWLPARPLLASIGVGIVAATAAAASFSNEWPLAGLAAVCAALGLTTVGWNGVYLAEVARAMPNEKVGSATGGVMMFTFLGIVVGPSTFGAVVAMSGSYTPAFIAANVLVAATVAVLALPRKAGR